MSPIPCLRAEIMGGAFVHERWGDLTNSRLIGLLDSSYSAELFAKALAAAESPDSGRSWIITDCYGADQQVWNRKRIDEAIAKATGAA